MDSKTYKKKLKESEPAAWLALAYAGYPADQRFTQSRLFRAGLPDLEGLSDDEIVELLEPSGETIRRENALNIVDDFIASLQEDRERLAERPGSSFASEDFMRLAEYVRRWANAALVIACIDGAANEAEALQMTRVLHGLVKDDITAEEILGHACAVKKKGADSE